MNIGLTADRYQNIPAHIILWILRYVGIRFSEVTVSIFQHPAKTAKNTRGMILGLHLPNMGNCGYDLSSLDQEETVASVLEDIEKNRTWFDFQYVVFHPPEARSDAAAFDFYVQNLRKVHYPLVLENTRGWTLHRFMNFHGRIRDILGIHLAGVCLDIPHAHLSGEDWTAFYQAFGDEVKVVHLSDCHTEEDSHLPFGCGGILDLLAILEALRSFGFNGTLNFEINPPSLRDLDAFFSNVLQSSILSQHDITQKGRRRMKHVARLGKIIGRIVGT